ncbi:glycolate oxidase subunit GlcF [Microbulbifer yueqingensis]|uniref:Glycolate oxidase iron-sulfur subunit n=1 Tax=Microbulbifer yueqingensis TaxID=658219 RepID=A0A1G9AMC1_9GAMM|nr:glycolate oxidase subunit GlcF [Microbulbifer yueqingensis]SDK28447.1 glycolate oxidase iron-sulfur subunit [Microbulbifer yueqingensis]
MQVNIIDGLLAPGDAGRAEKVLNACVHCGFCTATCPTYLQEYNELDSPRGRIYLMKEMLETGTAGDITRLHLDRCVTCLSCETTCPSGVEYHKLVAIGRATVEQLAPRGAGGKAVRALLRRLMLSPRLFPSLLRLGSFVAPLLPSRLRRVYFPARAGSGKAARAMRVRIASGAGTGAVILLPGCVQPSLRPGIDRAFERILSHCGVPLLSPPAAGCCGAVSFHTGAEEEGRDFARRNIDCWWPMVEGAASEAGGGIRAIVSTASGCGTQLKDYPTLLADDPYYSPRAERLAALLRDPVELVNELLGEGSLKADLSRLPGSAVFHCPCTLQHGQGLAGEVERIFRDGGIELPPVRDAHLCCGSAGTYSILQPKFARALRREKLDNLEASEPGQILTANIGCLLHLQAGTEIPVRHWLEALADTLEEAPH